MLDGAPVDPNQGGYSPFNFTWTQNTVFTPAAFLPPGVSTPVYFLLCKFTTQPTGEWRTLAFFSANSFGTTTTPIETSITNKTVTQGDHYALMAYDGTNYIYSEELIYDDLNFTVNRNSTTEIYTIHTNFMPNKGFYMFISASDTLPNDFFTNNSAYRNTPVTTLTIQSLYRENGKHLFVFGINTFGGIISSSAIEIIDQGPRSRRKILRKTKKIEITKH